MTQLHTFFNHLVPYNNVHCTTVLHLLILYQPYKYSLHMYVICVYNVYNIHGMYNVYRTQY